VSATVHSLDERRFAYKPQLERWLTTQEVADYFGFSTKWVQRRVKEGMPHARLGGRLRFKVTLVEAWLIDQ